MEERLWTVPQVAERLQVHEETIRRWLREGVIAGINLGGKSGWRVRDSAIEDFLNSRAELSKIPA